MRCWPHERGDLSGDMAQHHSHLRPEEATKHLTRLPQDLQWSSTFSERDPYHPILLFGPPSISDTVDRQRKSSGSSAARVWTQVRSGRYSNRRFPTNCGHRRALRASFGSPSYLTGAQHDDNRRLSCSGPRRANIADFTVALEQRDCDILNGHTTPHVFIRSKAV